MAHKGKRMVDEDLIAILESISNNGIAKITTSNIKTLTNEDIESLKCGDIVAKVTGDQKHAYIVSYKEDGQGICLTYIDATYVETISYDYTDGNWVYNSQDSTEIQSKLTAGDNISITDNVISATDTTYTAGTNITIEDGVISATGSDNKLYLHTIKYYAETSSGYKTNIHIQLVLPFSTPITSATDFKSVISQMTNNTAMGVPCVGLNFTGSSYAQVDSIYVSGTSLRCYEMNINSGTDNDHLSQSGTITVTDQVKEISTISI